jgi:putative ABC transport system permease protein
VLLLASLMALVIAAVGLYGVVSYLVTRRTRELGIRMALGADGGRIRRLVLGQGLLAAGLGILAGVLLALPPGCWRRCCSRWGAGIR